MGWLDRFPRSHLVTLSFVKKNRCVHMRGRAGPVTEISAFATEISVTGMKILISHVNTPARGDRDEPFLTK